MGGIEVGDGSRDPHLPGPLERQQPSCRRRGKGGRLGLADGFGQRDLDDIVGAGHEGPLIPRRRGEDGEDGGPHASLAHPGQVEMTTGTAGHEPGVILSGQRVVVTVEYGEHGLRR